MPHKRNPPACEGIIALARAVRAIVPQAVECVMADHERDKVVLQSEREFTSRLMCMTHAAVVKGGAVLRGLTVRTDMMERNLGALNGLLMSEPVMFALGKKFGKQEAHEMVYEICMHAFEHGEKLRDALLANNTVAAALTPAEIDAMLDPHSYIGMAEVFVDRVVAGVAGKL
jgi:adenylosuccinate lyase